MYTLSSSRPQYRSTQPYQRSFPPSSSWYASVFRLIALNLWFRNSTFGRLYKLKKLTGHAYPSSSVYLASVITLVVRVRNTLYILIYSLVVIVRNTLYILIYSLLDLTQLSAARLPRRMRPAAPSIHSSINPYRQCFYGASFMVLPITIVVINPLWFAE